MITDNWLISKKLVSKIMFIVESELILKRFNRWRFQHMIHYTYNSAPFLQETELLELITTKYVGTFLYHNYKHVGTFFVQRRWRQKYRRQSEHRNQAGASAHEQNTISP